MSERLHVELPDHVLDALVERVAALVVERLEPELEWMTAAECADWLRWPVKRVRNLTAAGRLPHVRDGGRVLYHRPTLRVHLLGDTPTPPAVPDDSAG